LTLELGHQLQSLPSTFPDFIIDLHEAELAVTSTVVEGM